MNKLRVHCNGYGQRWLLGTLARGGGALLFEYSAHALAEGLELSPLVLKLQPQAYGAFPAHQFGLPGLLADALPDGWGLLLMDRVFRQQGLDAAAVSPLQRLAFIGHRAMGALSFEPAEPWALTDEAHSLLALAQQVKQVLAGQGAEVLRHLAWLGGSPQGARPKVLVQLNPLTGDVSTAAEESAEVGVAGTEPWLVKFPAHSEHPEACAVEALYAELARHCGLEVPHTRHFELGPRLAAFGAQRFDREAGLRVPVHTLAGALNANFRLPGAVDYTTFLRVTRLFTRDEREVHKAFERAAFNVLFNNRDDHAKNLSFRLGADRRWRLAPAYDLTFSAGAGGEHAMDVCGHGRNITRAHLLQLARQGGLDAGFAAQVLDHMAAVAQSLRARAQSWPLRRATVSRLLAVVERNRALWA